MTADEILTWQDVEATKYLAGRRLLWSAVLVVALLVIVVASVIFGVRVASLDDALTALFSGTATAGQAAAAGRLPRTVLGLLSGIPLATAGGAMWAVTCNSLVDPGIFGVLSRAFLAVVIGLASFGPSHPYAQLLIAVLGAGVAAGLVYGIGSLGHGGATPLKLALAGAAISTACSSPVSAILMSRVRVMGLLRSWQIDGIGGTTWDRAGLVAPFLMAGALICLFSVHGMNSLALGDDVVTGLGENVMCTRLVMSVGAVISCGVTTVVCGSTAFVGLIVSHLCRLLVGTDHRWMLPFAGLAGACLLPVTDILGWVVTPNPEIDVGIITPFLGVPFFTWIV